MIPQQFKIKNPDDVKDNREYFIVKDGEWYRPGARGYTDDIAQAGVFVGAEAKRHLGPDGVRVVEVRNMMIELGKQVQDLLGRAARLSELMCR